MNSSPAPFCPRVRNSLMTMGSGSGGVDTGLKVAVTVKVALRVTVGVAVVVALGVPVAVAVVVPVDVSMGAALPVAVCVGVALAVLVNVALGVGVADGVNGCVFFGARVDFGMAGTIGDRAGVLVEVAVGLGVPVGVVVSVGVALEVAVNVGLAVGVFLRVALGAAVGSRGVSSACENDFAADMLATPRKSIDTAQRRKYRTAPRNQGSFLFVFSILHSSHRGGVHPSPGFEMYSVENCFWGIFPKPVFKIPGQLFLIPYTHHIKIDMEGQSTFLLARILIEKAAWKRTRKTGKSWK